MNYKSKYLKYKFKYLNAKKIYGGMEHANEPLLLPGEDGFLQQHIHTPAPDSHKEFPTENNIKDFKELYIRTVPNSIKAFAANNNIFKNAVVDPRNQHFNYNIDNQIENLLKDVGHKNFLDILSFIETNGLLPEGQAVFTEQKTYWNWYLISSRYVRVLALQELRHLNNKANTVVQDSDNDLVQAILHAKRAAYNAAAQRDIAIKANAYANATVSTAEAAKTVVQAANRILNDLKASFREEERSTVKASEIIAENNYYIELDELAPTDITFAIKANDVRGRFLI